MVLRFDVIWIKNQGLKSGLQPISGQISNNVFSGESRISLGAEILPKGTNCLGLEGATWGVVSCQLSVVSCQLSVVSCQWSVVSGQAKGRRE